MLDWHTLEKTVQEGVVMKALLEACLLLFIFFPS